MSTVYSDALNNKFLGNCKWGNHDINYPSTNYLAAELASTAGFPTSLTTFVSSFLTNYQVLISAAYPLGNPNGPSLFRFTFPGDTTSNASTKRFGFVGPFGSGYPALTSILYSDAGSRLIENNDNSYMPYDGNAEIRVALCGNSKSMAMTLYGLNTSRAVTQLSFFYAGELEDVNTNFGYYSTNYINKVICITARAAGRAITAANHYIVNTQKSLLQTGDAIYPIACQGGSPTPTGQWATDMYVFDDNATLGFPAIGKVPNMLLGVGTYTYLKPVQLITAPDAGSNLWLPVGTWGANRTLLMRCYATT